jgi:LysM repeat protein
MNKATLLTLPCLLATLLTPVLSCGEDFLLYTPKPSEGGQAPASPDQGIMVRSLTVKRGDTLAKLSKKYLGRASWFPQVLLFNSIKNPDLIITGDKLLVPVPSGQAAASEQKGTPEKKHAKGKRHHGGHRAAARHRGVAKSEAAEPEAAQPEALRREPVQSEAAKPETVKSKKSQQRAGTSKEQENYLQAKRAYLAGDYQKSLSLFTEYLRKYPNSAVSADASLYRADCLMHLSGQ